MYVQIMESATHGLQRSLNPSLVTSLNLIPAHVVMAIHNSNIADRANELIKTSTYTASIDDTSSSSRSLVIKLTAEHIPGAELQEPLERHGTPTLQWWLLCRILKLL